MFVKSCLTFVLVSYLCLKNANSQVPPKTAGTGNSLTIMQFNTWYNGLMVSNGKQKIANHILKNNPDFVTIQEVQTNEFLVNLMKALGPEWSYVARNTQQQDIALLTKHKIVESTNNMSNAVRAKVNVQLSDGSSATVNVWSLHLAYQNYGPYNACKRPMVSVDTLNDGERGRAKNVQDITSTTAFKQDMQRAGQELLLMAGDLNCPSHLDWIESAKGNHCGWVYEWPATKLLADAGLTDAFRQVHPDPAKVSGDTWSPVEKFMGGKGQGTPEPQDRIDMIFYNSSQWSPVNAEVYTGDQPIQTQPNVWNNDWPSDHASVVVQFKHV